MTLSRFTKYFTSNQRTDAQDCLLNMWQEKLPLGLYLGQFTDELGGDTIVEFVSGGAKNYGYLTKKGKTECKVRGFTLNYKTLQTLNYETM